MSAVPVPPIPPDREQWPPPEQPPQPPRGLVWVGIGVLVLPVLGVPSILDSSSR